MHAAARDFEGLVDQLYECVVEPRFTRTIHDSHKETATNDDMTIQHHERPWVITHDLQQRVVVHDDVVHDVVGVHEVNLYGFFTGFGPDDARCLAGLLDVAVVELRVGFFPVLHGAFSL